jgi:hypothetical protein
VHAAIDIDERLAFAGEALRVGVRQPVWMREALPDLPMASL